MSHFRTHYDNLKVARDAPPEVIQAAYRALVQAKQSAFQDGHVDSARTLSVIYESYRVLSDPSLRLQHDAWIRDQERRLQRGSQMPRPAVKNLAVPKAKSKAETTKTKRMRAGAIKEHFAENWKLYALAGFLFFVWFKGYRETSSVSGKAYSQTPEPVPVPATESTLIDHAEGGDASNQEALGTSASSWNAQPIPTEKLSRAPNGSDWPENPGYVDGYAKLHLGGRCAVTVDNSQNDSSVFVKLVSVTGSKAYPVRQFYIPAFGKFTVKNVRSGNYDVRYRDLETGGLSRTDSFELKQTKTEEGTSFSNISLTLYKVSNGNMETFGLSEEEF